ncbi:uncharacterized protein LOC120212812 [Hibiscus syriacus]|uniref:uncharacterized protein LOC120212812 n=1 Tax=Hibiscus syriacus TaxID=106335 RepID=UPI00192141DB|nr:uncharacterized protein LOC120212812 [Hibiscus syriacus]
MLYIVHRTTKYQYYETEIETKLHPFETVEDNELPSRILTDLPHGIMQPRSDLELKLWSKNSRSEVNVTTNKNLPAMPVCIKQKESVDGVVRKFLQRILPLFYSITMAKWMDGGILIGVAKPFT